MINFTSGPSFKGTVLFKDKKNIAKEVCHLPAELRVPVIQSLNTLKSNLESNTPDDRKLAIEFRYMHAPYDNMGLRVLDISDNRKSNKEFYAKYKNEGNLIGTAGGTFVDEQKWRMLNFDEANEVIDKVFAECENDTLDTINKQEVKKAEKGGVDYVLNRLA